MTLLSETITNAQARKLGSEPLVSFEEELHSSREFWSKYFSPFSTQRNDQLGSRSWQEFTPEEALSFVYSCLHPADHPLMRYVLAYSQRFTSRKGAATAAHDLGAVTDAHLVQGWPSTEASSDANFVNYLVGAVADPSKKFKEFAKGLDFSEAQIGKLAMKPSRTIPQAMSVGRPKSIKDINILWLLKNPGYGADHALRMQDEFCSQGGADHEIKEVLNDEENIRLSVVTPEEAFLPWDPAGSVNQLSSGWYVQRAAAFTGVDADRSQQWNKLLPHLGSDVTKRSQRIARFELFPYRTKGKDDIPKLVTKLNELGILLPSQEHTLRPLCTYLEDSANHQDHRFIICVRDSASWRNTIKAFYEANGWDSDTVLAQWDDHVWEFKGQGAYLSVTNLVRPFERRFEELQKQFGV